MYQILNPGHTDNATVMQSLCEQKKMMIIKKSQRLRKVLLKSALGLQSVADPIDHKQSFEHAQKTGRDWFGRSAVSLVSEVTKQSYFSLQIGFRLYGDQFQLEKGRDSLQPSGDLTVTDQCWGGDRSDDQSLIGCKVVSKRVLVIGDGFAICHWPVYILQRHFVTSIHRVHINDSSFSCLIIITIVRRTGKTRETA